MSANLIFLQWRRTNLEENVGRGKTLNEVAKTRIDLKERRDTINKITGEILEDMTKTSRDKIEKYMKPIDGEKVI